MSSEPQTVTADRAMIGGAFLDDGNVPPSLAWLYRYFTSDVQRQFVRYMVEFDTNYRFVERTGHLASKRYLGTMESEYRRLVRSHAAARQGGDIEAVVRIESGSEQVRF